MKRVFLYVVTIYAGLGHALTVDTLNNLPDDALVQQVAEGLNPDEPPAVLANAWRATFLLAFRDDVRDARVGSAFVVAREVHGDTQTLDLMTADHVLEGWCDERTCADVMVFDNGGIRNKGGTWWLKTYPLPNPRLEVLARDAADDLALVRITTSTAVDVTPLTFAADEARPGDPVYAVGYPQVFLRKTSKDPNPNLITRRWSRGVVLGTMNYQMLAGEYLTTDADALPGNSGGPVVNAAGEVTGVLGLTGAHATKDARTFAYLASPNGPNRGVQGAAVRLDRVTAFLTDVQMKTARQVARRLGDSADAAVIFR